LISGYRNQILRRRHLISGISKSNIVAEHIDFMTHHSKTLRIKKQFCDLAVSTSKIVGSSVSFNTVNPFLDRNF
jgi:hypothetical protein